MVGLLHNKIFLSTRPIGKSDELKLILQNHGAEFHELPMIDILPVEIDVDDIEIIKMSYDWIIFTSANGIEHFFQQLKKIQGHIAIGNTQIAVIGKRTAAELSKYGYVANYINTSKTADDFAIELRTLFSNTKPKVLLPVGNLASKTMEEGLKQVAEVHRINIYNTSIPQNIESVTLQKIVNNNYDLIIFTSPSSFINLHELISNKIDIKNLKAACIGSTTSKALADKGVVPLIISNVMSSEGIANAIIDYYSNKNNKVN